MFLLKVVGWYCVCCGVVRWADAATTIDPSLGNGRTFGLDIRKYDKVRQRYLNVYGTNEEEDDLGRDIELKKIVGIGASPSFIGGTMVGNEENSTLEVYNRYILYNKLIGEEVPGLQDHCSVACPSHLHVHCNSGLCFCDSGYVMDSGVCVERENVFFKNNTIEKVFVLGSSNDKMCNTSAVNNGNDECWKRDINTVCEFDEDVNRVYIYDGACKCKPPTKYNAETEACELYVDVDCSDFKYDLPADPTLLKIGQMVEKQELPVVQQITSKAHIASLLEYLSPSHNLTRAQYREAFCRDSDVFALDLEWKRTTFGSSDVFNIIFWALGIIGTVVVVGVCVTCCVCCCCYKKCKDCIDSTFNPDPLRGMSDEVRVAGVAMARAQDAVEESQQEKHAMAMQNLQRQQQQTYPQQQAQQQLPYPQQQQPYPQQGYPQQPTGYQPVPPS